MAAYSNSVTSCRSMESVTRIKHPLLEVLLGAVCVYVLCSASGTTSAEAYSGSRYDSHPICLPGSQFKPDSHYFKKPGSIVLGAIFSLFRREELQEDTAVPASVQFADLTSGGVHEVCREFRQNRLVDSSYSFMYIINQRYGGRIISAKSGLSVDLGYSIGDSCSSLFVNSEMALRFGGEAPLYGRTSFCALHDELSPSCHKDDSAVEPDENKTSNPHNAVTQRSVSPSSADCPVGNVVPERNMAGVVGLTESRAVLPISTILALEHLTHVSSSATGNGFVNHSGGQLPYFFRTVPPDKSQAQALIDIAVHFKWEYIITLASSNDNYGTPGLVKLHQAALDAKICIAYSTTFSSDDPFRDLILDNIIENLKKYDEAKAVILFARTAEAELLFKAIIKDRQNNTATAKRLDKMWLGSDYWGTSSSLPGLENLTEAVPAALVLRPRLPNRFTCFIQELVDEYVDHLLDLNITSVQSQTHSPWLCRFWEEVLQCNDACQDTYQGRTLYNRSCVDSGVSLNETILENTVPRLGWTRNVMAATELLIRAIKILLDDIPANTAQEDVADILLNLTSSTAMQEAVRRVTLPCHHGKCQAKWETSTRHGNECKLITETSETSAAFSIANFVSDGNDSAEAGIWEQGYSAGSAGNLTLHGDRILWSERVPSNTTSTCKRLCGLGYGTKASTERPCCTVCIKCSPTEKAPKTGFGPCVACPPGHISSLNKTACESLPVRFLDWDGTVGKVLVTVVVLFAGLDLFTLAVFLYYRNSPIAKASDYRLMVLMLVGMLVGYFASLLQVGEPGRAHCTIAKLTQSPPFIFTTVTLLIKTSRLARMAMAAQKLQKFKHKWTLSMAAQIMLIVLVSLLGIGLDSALTLTDVPGVTPHYEKEYVFLLCDYNPARSAVLDLFIFVLIVITSVFAFITRKMRLNFNEARHIFLTAFCLCAVWAMLAPPIYFSESRYVGVLYSLRLITHMVAIWLFLFTPRLYIFLFRKDRNSVYPVSDRRKSLLNRTTSVVNNGC